MRFLHFEIQKNILFKSWTKPLNLETLRHVRMNSSKNNLRYEWGRTPKVFN